MENFLLQFWPPQIVQQSFSLFLELQTWKQMLFSILFVVHEMRKSVIIEYFNNRIFARCDDLVRLLMLSRNCLPSFTLSLPLISDLMIILTYGDGKMLVQLSLGKVQIQEYVMSLCLEFQLP